MTIYGRIRTEGVSTDEHAMLSGVVDQRIGPRETELSSVGYNWVRSHKAIELTFPLTFSLKHISVSPHDYLDKDSRHPTSWSSQV